MAFKLFSKDSLHFSQERRQQFLIAILIVVALIIVLILYFGFWQPSPAPSPVSSTEPGQKIFLENVVKKIDFDISFLKEATFQALKAYGQWPVEIGEKSRPNPFLPY